MTNSSLTNARLAATSRANGVAPLARPLGGTLLGVLLALLTACAGAPRQDAPVDPDWEQRYETLLNMSEWTVNGRIGVRDQEENHSARMEWQQQNENYEIKVWGTLSAGMTEISGSPDHVILQQRGEEPLTARSPEQLVYENLGYELPVSQLRYWIKGIPAPEPEGATRPGGAGRQSFNTLLQLVELEQSGWHIQYLGYTRYETMTLPNRIRMRNNNLRLDFVRLNWEVGS